MAFFIILLIAGIGLITYSIFKQKNEKSIDKESIRNEILKEQEASKLKEENENLKNENNKLKENNDAMTKQNKKYKVIFWVALIIILLTVIGMIVA